MVKPVQKREAVEHLVESRSLSLRQACHIMGMARSGYYYVHKQPQNDQLVIAQLQNLAEKHPTYGFRKMFYRLRNEGYEWNHKRVYRIYKSLNCKRPTKHH